ncbi:MAG: VWA domain-containing protein [Candidatus Xenobiia bacterium LiM19]
MNTRSLRLTKPLLLYALLLVIALLPGCTGCNKKVVEEEQVQGGHIILAANPAPSQNTGEQAFETAVSETVKEQVMKSNAKHVELVFCLDTSSSMDNLIESAKQRLWDITKEIKGLSQAPTLRIALLAYGSPSFGSSTGYVKLINDFTEDTDAIHTQLTALRCNGGEEYVARVVSYAIDNLSWGTQPDTLRTIFVAGNENASQDRTITVEAMLDKAKNTNTLVNTIFCGSEKDYSAKEWKDIADKSGGKYCAVEFKMNIPQIKLPIKLPININIPGLQQPTAIPVVPTQATQTGQPAAFPTSPAAFPTATATTSPGATQPGQGYLPPFASPTTTAAVLPSSIQTAAAQPAVYPPAQPAPAPTRTKAAPLRTTPPPKPPRGDADMIKVEGTITGMMSDNLLVRETDTGRNRTFRFNGSTKRTPSSWQPASNDTVTVYYSTQNPTMAARLDFVR